MDKNSGDSMSSGVGRQNPNDLYLKQLNRISHKISKPSTFKRTPPPPTNHRFQQQVQIQNQQQQQLQQQQQQQQQPPVYNINKSDFRDVVQKLTGSPAHDRFSTPPPIQPPKPTSSRLQRIRPPPLSQVANRPPPTPPINHTTNPTDPYFRPSSAAINPNNSSGFVGGARHISPLSAFPAAQAPAESPISAYMRYLQSSTPTPLDLESKRYSGLSPLAPLVSPRWNNPPPGSFQQQLQQQHQQQVLLPSPNSAMPPTSPFMVPNSPLGFGQIGYPRSPYPLLSPSLLLSPTSGQLGFPQFPLSPRLPVLSPRWRGL